MKPHPRLRKSIKWCGLAASVLLLAAWIGSVWYYAWWIGRWGVAVNLMGGRISLVDIRTAPGIRTGWTLEPIPQPGMFLWFDSTSPGSLPFVTAPLWALAAPTLLATAAAWRRDTVARRRDRIGCCANCAYDRRGLAPDAVCPECGSFSP